MDRTTVAVIGTALVGSELLGRVARSDTFEVVATADGADGLVTTGVLDEVDLIFDAGWAPADGALAVCGKNVIDLTPAAPGPHLVPAVNLGERLDEGAEVVSLGTGAGQASIPVVAGVARVTPVSYAESVVSMASRSVGPEARAAIDQLLGTTARGIEVVGGAGRGEAVLILTPGEPPPVMRGTVSCLIADADHDAIRESVGRMVATVAEDVPGYRFEQGIQFSRIPDGEPVHTLTPRGAAAATTRVSVFLEVETAGDHLAAYAGDVDILTAAAVRIAEGIARKAAGRVPVGVVR